jgi:hypothetical protein
MRSMVRKMLRASVTAALGLIAMMATYGMATTASMAGNAEDKVPDISTIMTKSFKGKDSLKGSISADVKGEKWEDAQKLAKEWSDLGASLGKNKPPKGDAKSWEDLTKKFAESTKAISEAAEKKDKSAITKAMSTFDCKTCHSAHKQ